MELGGEARGSQTRKDIKDGPSFTGRGLGFSLGPPPQLPPGRPFPIRYQSQPIQLPLSPRPPHSPEPANFISLPRESSILFGSLYPPPMLSKMCLNGEGNELCNMGAAICAPLDEEETSEIAAGGLFIPLRFEI